MQVNEFKRYVAASVNPAEVKKGYRLAGRARNTAMILVGVTNAKVAVSNLSTTLEGYLSGASQLTPDLRDASATLLGTVYQTLFVLAKLTKTKPPSAARKTTIAGKTTTEQVLRLQSIAAGMLDMTANITNGVDGYVDGKGLLTEEAMGHMNGLVLEAMTYAFSVTTLLTGMLPLEVMALHVENNPLNI